MELVEYESATYELTPAELAYLLPFVKSGTESDEPGLLETILPTRRLGVYVLKAGPYTGRLGLPTGRQIDFISRFPFDDLIQLIGFSGRDPAYVDNLRVASTGQHFLVDLIAAAFSREVERLARAGLAKGYRPRRYLRPPYPGQIDTAYHLGRLQGREDRLATSAKRLTHNVPTNQALALALDILRRVPLDERLVPGLSRIAACLRSVERPPMSANDVARIPLSRLTLSYRKALGLAELIIRSQSVAPRGEVHPGASVLFYMPKVWEACVLRWVEEAWGEHSVEGGFGFDLTSAGEMKAVADVVVRAGDRVVALYDAKYKRPGKAPSTSDVYQMVTYCKRLGVNEATLVYPTLQEPRHLRVDNYRVRVVGIRFPGFDHEECIQMLRPTGPLQAVV